MISQPAGRFRAGNRAAICVGFAPDTMHAMRFAVIETSSEWCSLALWDGGEAIALEERAGTRHGELVLPMLDALYARAGFGAAQLDAVVFGAGPGAFTGLRIACGIAQGLAFAHDLPVLGVSTLEAMAEESRAPRVLVALDARMQEIYCAAYERSAGGWVEVTPPACLPPEALVVPAGEGWLGAGNGFSAYGERIPAHVRGALLREVPELRPGALAMARLAAPRLAAGGGVDAALALPVYLRDKVALTSVEQAGARAASLAAPQAIGQGNAQVATAQSSPHPVGP